MLLLNCLQAIAWAVILHVLAISTGRTLVHCLGTIS